MKKKRAIIFGASGQDGYYLNELLIINKLEIINISRSAGDIIGDISDLNFVENVIRKYNPSFIFHFAAISSTVHDTIFHNNQSIYIGTINILESVRRFCPKSKIFLSGSALQFKNNGTPIDENTPLDYSSPYSVSRTNSINMGRYFREKFGINVYVGYFFNHDSPLRKENHINQKIVSFVKKIESGSTEKLVIGNMEARKEFNFAKDVVDAVWILVNQNLIFEAIIGSGLAYSIKDWVKYCFEQKKLNWEEFVITDNSYKSEYDILISNPTLIKKLGWLPKTSFFELADLMLETKSK